MRPSLGAIREILKRKDVQEHRRRLEHRIVESDELRDTMATPGWKHVDAFMESFRERSYAEFKRGERSADLYRSDITVLDFISNSLAAMVGMGAKLRSDLEKIPEPRSRAS